MKTALKIPAISGKVHLGCTTQERKTAQSVQVQIEILFAKAPKAVKTDSIDHTPCYAEMTKIVLLSYSKKEYATIEHLCFECHKNLLSYLKSKKKFKKSHLTTTLKKMAPPVKEITDGSVFIISQKV